MGKRQSEHGKRFTTAAVVHESCGFATAKFERAWS